MFSEELSEYLKKPRLARMSTIDPNGYPHTVPVWYAIDGDEFVIVVSPASKKVGHLKVNPKGCISIGGGPDDGGGWMFKGQFTLTDDNGWPWLQQMTPHYEPAEEAAKNLAEWAQSEWGLIRMKVEKIIKVI